MGRIPPNSTAIGGIGFAARRKRNPNRSFYLCRPRNNDGLLSRVAGLAASPTRIGQATRGFRQTKQVYTSLPSATRQPDEARRHGTCLSQITGRPIQARIAIGQGDFLEVPPSVKETVNRGRRRLRQTEDGMPFPDAAPWPESLSSLTRYEGSFRRFSVNGSRGCEAAAASDGEVAAEEACERAAPIIAMSSAMENTIQTSKRFTRPARGHPHLRTPSDEACYAWRTPPARPSASNGCPDPAMPAAPPRPFEDASPFELARSGLLTNPHDVLQVAQVLLVPGPADQVGGKRPSPTRIRKTVVVNAMTRFPDRVCTSPAASPINAGPRGTSVPDQAEHGADAGREGQPGHPPRHVQFQVFEALCRHDRFLSRVSCPRLKRRRVADETEIVERVSAAAGRSCRDEKCSPRAQMD